MKNIMILMIAGAALCGVFAAACRGSLSPRENLASNLGVCTSPENSDAVGAAGFGYIEPSVGGFLIPEDSDEDFAPNLELAKASSLPLRCANGFYPTYIKLTGPEADIDRAVNYAAVAFERAEMVGITTIVLGSGGAREIPEGFDRDEARGQFVELMRQLGPLARAHGITVAIEPLRTQECNFINSVREGTSIAREVAHPNIGVLADIYHMTQVGEGPDAIVEAGSLLKHCHIAENARRTPPGVDGDDFNAYFDALEQIGYTGRVSVECSWGDFEAELPVAHETMIKQILKK